MIKLKIEIETNQKKYEDLIDTAAEKISSFVKKQNKKIYLNKFVNKSKLRRKITSLRKKNFQ